MTVFTIVPDGPEPERPEQPAPVDLWPSPNAPLDVAYALAEERLLDDIPTLQRWQSSWWEYRGPHWVEVEEGVARKWVYNRLRDATYVSKDRHGMPEEKPWNPDRTKVTNVLDAYGSAVAMLTKEVRDGTWLPTGEVIPGVVATPDGLFQVSTRQTSPATPKWFTTWALPYSYDPDAPDPETWLAFLKSVWPDDEDTIAMLQEWLGYLVSGRTDLQKAMLLVGPKRSGKGTILRTAAKLAGTVNTTSPTLAGLTTQFGLQDAIGKTLISIGDARLSGNTSTLVERLLSIIGEDNITVDRKHREPWTGRLPGRIMIASNEVPDFRDASGAIGSRFLVARMVHSFYDREDIDLERKLDAELPGIFKWALDGLDRLTEQGRFTQSETSLEARREMEEAESPIAQFVDAACIVGGNYSVPKQVLYDVWDDWRARNGYAAANIATFARNLRAAVPTVSSRRAGSDGGRVQMFDGIGLRESYVGTEASTSFTPASDTQVRNTETQQAAFKVRVIGK